MNRSTKWMLAATILSTLGLGGLAWAVYANQSKPVVASVPEHHASTQIAAASDRDTENQEVEGSGANTPPTVTTTPTAGNANQVPTSVSQVGEAGENIYDAAKANNWTQATAKLNSLKDAAKQLDTESKISENPNEDQLDTVIAGLNKAVPAKNRLATMRAANEVTRLAANLSALFNPQVPVSVALLDYYGRQLEIGVAAQDMTQLKTTAKDMQQTWNALRPAVESHGGSAEAKKFNNLVTSVEAAKSFNDYSHLATPVLEQVDNLEKVFTH